MKVTPLFSVAISFLLVALCLSACDGIKLTGPGASHPNEAAPPSRDDLLGHWRATNYRIKTFFGEYDLGNYLKFEDSIYESCCSADTPLPDPFEEREMIDSLENATESFEEYVKAEQEMRAKFEAQRLHNDSMLFEGGYDRLSASLEYATLEETGVEMIFYKDSTLSKIWPRLDQGRSTMYKYKLVADGSHLQIRSLNPNIEDEEYDLRFESDTLRLISNNDRFPIIRNFVRIE